MYCQRQRCSPRSVVSGDIRLMPTFAGFAGEVVSNESAVIKNASFLFRSLHLPCEVPHWLCIWKFTRVRLKQRVCLLQENRRLLTDLAAHQLQQICQLLTDLAKNRLISQELLFLSSSLLRADKRRKAQLLVRNSCNILQQTVMLNKLNKLIRLTE